MTLRAVVICSLTGLVVVGALDGATVTRQQAESLSRKIAVIKQQGQVTRKQGQPTNAPVRRTTVTESEVNSWFTYSSEADLPEGVINPQVTILPGGAVKGQATVDLEAFSKRRSRGSALDPWNFLGKQVDVAVTGMLRTKDGQGRFEMDQAEVAGIPVPSALLQELVSSYSKSSDQSAGIRLDQPFELPAKIKQIEVTQGQFIVVQ